MIEVQPQCEVGTVGGVTPIEKTGELGLWEAKLLRWGEEPSCSGVLGKAHSKVGAWDAEATAELAGSPPPLPHPSQAALVEGSAQRRNLLGGGCWAVTSPFSLHGDPGGCTTVPTFWGFIGWVGLGFLGFGGFFFAFVLFLHLAHAGQWSPIGSVPLSGSHALVQGSLSGAGMF